MKNVTEMSVVRSILALLCSRTTHFKLKTKHPQPQDEGRHKGKLFLVHHRLWPQPWSIRGYLYRKILWLFFSYTGI